jgi:hypothetical protein
MNHGGFLSLARALAATGVGALASAAPASAVPAQLTPTADVHVSAAQPARNFGSATRLVSARRPAQRAFVRFAIGAPPRSGERLILRVYALSPSKSGLLLRHASDRPWKERAITFRTAPRTGPRLVRSGPLQRHRWARIDVTNLVGPSGVVALALAAAGSERIELASRELGGGLGPRLLRTGLPAALAGPLTLPPLLPPPPRPEPGPAPGRPPPAPVDPAHPCGVAAEPPVWEHVIWIVFENKDYASVIGSANAPYFTSLAATCASAANMWATAKPSLPNYIAMTSGSTQGITDNSGPASHPLDVPSIYSQLGPDWRVLQESMPTSCATANASPYAVRHNPAAYYTNLGSACPAQNVPLTDPPDLSARFTFITPNLCNSMHSCSVATGDAWLATWMAKIFDSRQYRAGATAVFVTFDEGGATGQQIPTIVAAPSVPAGLGDLTRYDHFSLLLTTQEMLGLPPLGAAATATSMRAAMHV